MVVGGDVGGGGVGVGVGVSVSVGVGVYGAVGVRVVVRTSPYPSSPWSQGMPQ